MEQLKAARSHAKCIPGFTPAICSHVPITHPTFLLPNLFSHMVAHPKMMSRHPRDGQGVAAWSLPPPNKIISRIPQPICRFPSPTPVGEVNHHLVSCCRQPQKHLLSAVASSEGQRGGCRGGRGGGIVSPWVFTSLAVVFKNLFFSLRRCSSARLLSRSDWAPVRQGH